jgi:hypothetical protein
MTVYNYRYEQEQWFKSQQRDYIQGTLDGVMIEYMSDGLTERDRYYYVNDKRHGQAIWRTDDYIEYVPWVDGTITGLCIKHWNDGRISWTEMTNCSFRGVSIEWAPNSAISIKKIHIQ